MNQSIQYSPHILLGEGNGNPLHCCCLENPTDRGFWNCGRLQFMGSKRVRHNWVTEHWAPPSILLYHILLLWEGQIRYFSELASLEERTAYYVSTNKCIAACEDFCCSKWDLVPWPGIEPRPPALGVWSLSHWTTRKVPLAFFFKKRCFYFIYFWATWHVES